MHKKTYIFIFLFLSLGVFPAEITRNQVISMARNYVNVKWVPFTDECNDLDPTFYAKPYFKSGEIYTGEAYCYGGFDRYSWEDPYGNLGWPNNGYTFPKRISLGFCPGGVGTGIEQYLSVAPVYLAGIDCSGYATRCWGIEDSFHPHTTMSLWSSGIALAIDYEDLKPGDLLDNPGDHVVIYSDGDVIGSWNIYEAVPKRVIYRAFPSSNPRYNYLNYIPLSIFPQFSDESPGDGESVVLTEEESTLDVSLTIKASGTVKSSGVTITINGVRIDNFSLESQGSKEWLLKAEDYDVSEEGKFDVKVVAKNDVAITSNEYIDKYEWSFTVNGPPVVEQQCVEKEGDGSLQRLALSNSAILSASIEGEVCFLYPQADDIPIDINTVSFTFSKPMDVTTTTPAVTTDFGFSPYWDGEETIKLNLTENLDYCENYTVTISETATDTSGVHLDGDENGEPGGDYYFTFTTEGPELTVNAFPVVAHVEEGQSQTHSVFTRGDKLKDDVNCNIAFDVSNPGGWSVYGANGENFPLSQGGEHRNTYTTTNYGATAPLNVSYRVGAECGSSEGEGYYWSAQGHMADHPDENQSPGKMNYPTPWLTRTQSFPSISSKLRGASPSSELPDIGILLSGWADGYGHILGRYGIETLPVKPDLKILNNTEVNISDSVELLVIGSAGLKGLKSPTFKNDLEDYVVNGGNLLVFKNVSHGATENTPIQSFFPTGQAEDLDVV